MEGIDMEFINETLKTPIIGEYDVIVVGGGPAGACAAICAARSGMRTVLIERFNCLGGGWTTGFINPFFDYEDKCGIVNELVSDLRASGNWGGFWNKSFNYEYMKYLLETKAKDAGVELLYNTVFSRTICDKNTVKGVIADNINGRFALMSRVVIDATGDGAVAASAGCPFEIGEDGDPHACQAMTLMFLVGNIPEKYKLGTMIFDILDAVYKKGGKKIGGFIGGSYLSSTESEDRAKLLYSGSNVSDADKNYGHKVRAVAMIDTELSVCVEPAPAPAPVDALVDAECPTIWKVGDYYNVNGKEGVVFWVDQTGKHGKIVSVDQSKLEWCLYDGYDDKTRRKSTDEDNGMKNLQEVMKLKDWQINYCAHAWCADHGAGWYLPAVNELKELMQEDNMNKVNATLAQMNRELVAGRIAEADKYWSSTCGSKEKRFAWFVFAGGAYQFVMSVDFYVRAVAAF